MGWKNGNGLGKCLQGTTINLRAYHRSNELGARETTDLHGDLGWSKTNDNVGRVLEALRRDHCVGG